MTWRDLRVGEEVRSARILLAWTLKCVTGICETKGAGGLCAL